MVTFSTTKNNCLNCDFKTKVKIDAMQFGFMPGKRTTDAIFTVRQMQEKVFVVVENVTICFQKYYR